MMSLLKMIATTLTFVALTSPAQAKDVSCLISVFDDNGVSLGEQGTSKEISFAAEEKAPLPTNRVEIQWQGYEGTANLIDVKCSAATRSTTESVRLETISIEHGNYKSEIRALLNEGSAIELSFPHLDKDENKEKIYRANCLCGVVD